MRLRPVFAPMVACAGVGLSLALVLTVVLARVNPGPWSGAPLVELFAVCLWIALLMSGVFGAAAAMVCFLLRLFLPSLRGHATAFVVSGTVALHGFWALLNRLQQPQHAIFPPRFLPWDGAVQLALMFLLVPALVAAGVGIGARKRWGMLAAAGVVAAVVGLLAWNSAGERARRDPTFEQIRSAAREGRAAKPVPPTGGGGPRVLVLGVDGLSWNVLEPMMRVGLLPNFTRLVRDGAIAYLDNGNDSFSPRIWNTIWSGRTVRDHGVHDFLKLVLPRSERVLPNLPAQHPSIDVVFGLRQLFRRIPNPGLWVLADSDSRDVRVKRVWDVASEHGLRVGVANALTLMPVAPVRGVAISYEPTDLGGRTFPPELAETYDPPLTSPQRLHQWYRMLEWEVPYTIGLFREHEVDLAIYYTHFLDYVTHRDWNFFAADDFLLAELPRGWSDARWRNEILSHSDATPFAAYVVADWLLGAFREAFPDTLLLVCSDHGWTFSGFHHYGSPDGVLILAGGEVTAGSSISSAGIADVAPTLLALMGVPLSQELAGAPLDEAFEHPLATSQVASYGDPERREGDRKPADDETLERLEALGYVQ